MASSEQSRDVLHSVETEVPSSSQAETPEPAPKRKWIRYAVIGGVLVAAAVVAIIVVFTTTSTDTESKTKLTLDDVLGNRLAAQHTNGTWHRDGRLLQFNVAGDLVLYDVAAGTERVLLAADTEGLSTSYTQQLSADGRFVLLEHLYEHLNRHSRRSTYHLHELADRNASRYLQHNGRVALIDYAAFGPVGSQLVIVQDHDVMYVADSSNVVLKHRLTSTGSATRFNGVSDWVYEEEIFGRTDALWFSPDGRRLAFVEFDDSNVGAITMWHWGEESGTIESQYPDARHIRYPKVGTPNPRVRLLAVQLPSVGEAVQNSTAYPSVVIPVPQRLIAASDEEPVLSAVQWWDDEHVVAVWSNREQNRAYVESCRYGAECSTIVDLASTTGWLDIPKPLFINTRLQQIALIQPVDNHNQIMSYSLRDQSQRRLSEGTINVERIVHWDSTEDVIFFLGNAQATPQERNLYSVPDGVTPYRTRCLSCEHTQDRQYTHFDADFSAGTDKHLVLRSQGPAVPRHDVYAWNSTAIWLVRPLQTNAQLTERLRLVAEPQVRYLEVPLIADGGAYTARVRLLLPPDFDESKTGVQYPMVVRVYGGPSTFAGTSAWSLGWTAFMASNRSVVIAHIDARGSSRRDVRLMHSVYRQLGGPEVADQIEVAGYLGRTLAYIDAKRIGIWGHSYGGYATGMALATDSENVLRCGASVAPVTDWKLYDTLYTERYMGLASDNVDGYRNGSLLEKASNLRNKRLYLVHGTADDNVHYQMSMELARRLELADIEFEQMIYPNENHSLGGVQSYYYKQLTRFFDQCFEE